MGKRSGGVGTTLPGADSQAFSDPCGHEFRGETALGNAVPTPPKIDELEKLGVTLLTRLDNADKELSAVYAAHKEFVQQLADLRREYEREIALLKREVEELKKWKDDSKKQGEERTRRLWAFGPNLLAAVIGGLIASAIAYFTKRP